MFSLPSLPVIYIVISIQREEKKWKQWHIINQGYLCWAGMWASLALIGCLDLWYIFNYIPARFASPYGASMYFAIEGVIGVGKTTLARLLQPRFESNLLLEVFEENPFLSNFYDDRARYAFQTQVFFLLSRYKQQSSQVPTMLSSGVNLISDYTFEKDALFARINIQGDELDMYYRVHEALAEKIPSPDLVVYLRADTDSLMQRIAMRDRPFERQMERSYIHELNQAYDAFFLEDTNHPSQVLTIDSNHLDFVRNADDLSFMENRIRQVLLMPPFQPELPLHS
jgi:deoxyguanosine kinase